MPEMLHGGSSTYKTMEEIQKILSSFLLTHLETIPRPTSNNARDGVNDMISDEYHIISLQKLVLNSRGREMDGLLKEN